MAKNLWKQMKDAKEDAYFRDINKAALEKIAKKEEGDPPKKSPISGKEMTKKAIYGIVLDFDPDSGGVWFDGGELEEFLNKVKEFEDADEFLADVIAELKK